MTHDTDVARPDLTATVVFPLGASARLEQSLRTPITAAPFGLSDENLKRLIVSIGELPLTSAQSIVASPHWDSAGRMHAFLHLKAIQAPMPWYVRLATPDGAVELLIVIDSATAAAGAVRIDARSTAAARLQVRLARLGMAVSQVPEEAIDLLLPSILSAATPAAQTTISHLTDILAQALWQGIPAASLAYLDGIRPVSSGSGGGGGGSGGGSAGGAQASVSATVLDGDPTLPPISTMP